MKYILYVGFSRNTEVEISVSLNDIENGYVEIRCLECSGTGYWECGIPEVSGDCISCKATGKILVNC